MHTNILSIYMCRCICFMVLQLLNLTITRDDLRTFYSIYPVINNIFLISNKSKQQNSISLREVENPFTNTPLNATVP